MYDYYYSYEHQYHDMKDLQWYDLFVEPYNTKYPENSIAFIKRKGGLHRYQPHGVTWNDNYCRKIEKFRNPGCFVEIEFDQNLETVSLIYS